MRLKLKLKQKPDNIVDKKSSSIFKKEYLLILILTAVVIVIFLSGQDLSFSFFENEKQSLSSDYATTVEEGLKSILSDVDGAGKINVFVTVDGSQEEIVLKNVETKTENGIKTTVESIVLVGGKPYVTKTNNPRILGVAIVCEGADDLSVKLKITEIVTTTLNVNSDSVRIIKMK